MNKEIFKKIEVLFPEFWKAGAGEVLKVRSFDCLLFPTKAILKVVSNHRGYMECVIKIHEPWAPTKLVPYRISIDLYYNTVTMLPTFNKLSKAAIAFQNGLLGCLEEKLDRKLDVFITNYEHPKGMKVTKLEEVYRVWSFGEAVKAS
jgi:hypothetical protein